MEDDRVAAPAHFQVPLVVVEGNISQLAELHDPFFTVKDVVLPRITFFGTALPHKLHEFLVVDDSKDLFKGFFSVWELVLLVFRHRFAYESFIRWKFGHFPTAKSEFFFAAPGVVVGLCFLGDQDHVRTTSSFRVEAASHKHVNHLNERFHVVFDLDPFLYNCQVGVFQVLVVTELVV